MNSLPLLLALPLFLLPVWLKSIRWNYLLKVQDIQVPAARAFHYYVASLFWGIITPGRIGEMVKIYYLNQRGVSVGRASLSVVLDRILDVALLFFLTLLGLSCAFKRPTWFFGSLGLMGFIGLCIYAMRHRLPVASTWRRFLAMFPAGLQDQVSYFMEQFHADSGKFSLAQILLLSAFSAIIWLAYIIPFLLLASNIGITVSPFFLITGVLAAAVIAMVPISIAGIGTREAFLIFYFGQLGVPSEKSLFFSFMFIYMNLFALLIGACAQMGQRIPKFSLGKE